jgi:spermidine/putrescine-binding protein
MRHFLVAAAAAATCAAMLTSVPASAAENWGPSKVGNQCFTAAASQGRELYFGSWGSCPQPASTVAPAPAPTAKKKKPQQ